MSHPTLTQTPVYVYEKPVRLWHWINALALVVLAVTGYLIGSPPVVLGGEASSIFCSAISVSFIFRRAMCWL